MSGNAVLYFDIVLDANLTGEYLLNSLFQFVIHT